MIRRFLVWLGESIRKEESRGGENSLKVELFLISTWLILTALFSLIYSLFAKVTQNVFSYSTVIIFAAVLIVYLIADLKNKSPLP